MTRINVVPTSELCDQHLLAEHRELTRIPNMLLVGKLQYHYDDRPKHYTLGEGHVKFFTNKLEYLFWRYKFLTDECRRRGFNVQFIFPDVHAFPDEAWKCWTPTWADLETNRARIQERMPENPRFTK